MLSAEGNAGERGKNNKRSNKQKSNLAFAAHFFCTFLCRCFARLQRETSRNFFVEEMSRTAMPFVNQERLVLKFPIIIINDRILQK